MHKYMKMEAVVSNGATTTTTNAATSTFGSKLHLEAMQTVTPTNPTDPKLSLPVSFASGNLDSGIFSRRFSIVLCYRKASEEDSASLVAGWMRESLGKALSEQPILAGRLRRKDDVVVGGDDGDQLEIVSNDSGVRLIEAQFSMTLQEFLDLEEKKEAESQLVFWDDIDYKQNPQFSPLCYIQVSNFKCGGYGIGISFSLLLFDPFSMASFLKKWTRIHLEMMISKTDNYNQLPVFYRPKIRNNNRSSRGLPINSRTKTAADAAQTMIFDVTSKNLNEEIHKSIVALCVHESVKKLELKTPGNVSVIVKEPPEEVDNHHQDLMICKVQNFIKEEILVQNLLPSSTTGRVMNGITFSSSNSNWNRLLGIDGICFREGNKPVHVSCWINSVLDEAFLIIFPSHSQMEDENNNGAEGLKIIVALPN